jgi:hypothetical protein
MAQKTYNFVSWGAAVESGLGNLEHADLGSERADVFGKHLLK